MTKLLYLRLAANNLWKNRQTYLPFLLASTLLTFTMYSFLMITFNPGFEQINGGMSFVMILQFGIFVIGLFAAIFLFYANSFLIKRRKKEMGLYSILGMEKKHIARVLLHELNMTWVFSMLLGLGIGILLTRLLFLLIGLALRVEVPLVGSVSTPAVVSTLALFAVLYLLLIINNTWQVRSVSPIDLLRGGQTGEREPKARWFLAVIGILCMGTGYYLAQIVENPMAAIALFFVAVMLVIIGTYLLFLSGSIAVLKLMKRNKHYYYKSRHFVTVSGMLYRMKQNAAGLASIAILCTMAMITIGTTIALYNGSEKMLDEYYPSDVQVTLNQSADQAMLLERNQALAAQAGITITDQYAFHAFESSMGIEQNRLIPEDELNYNSLNDYGKLHAVMILTDEQFAPFAGAPLGLAPDELGIFTTADETPTSLTTNDGRTYRLRVLSALPAVPCFSMGSSFSKTYLIAPTPVVAESLLLATGAAADKAVTYTTQWNVQGEAEQLDAYYRLVNGESQWQNNSIRIKDGLRVEWYALHGGFLFVGIFLGFIFLMGTALIIYFKQISEGYQDHDRFIIMQKVGMSSTEVRATVSRQILMVFFLPLLVAICHVAGSLHMMIKLLQVFGLMDVSYITLNTFGSAIGIGLLYALFYSYTAKTYYKMVKFE